MHRAVSTYFSYMPMVTVFVHSPFCGGNVAMGQGRVPAAWGVSVRRITRSSRCCSCIFTGPGKLTGHRLTALRHRVPHCRTGRFCALPPGVMSRSVRNTSMSGWMPSSCSFLPNAGWVLVLSSFAAAIYGNIGEVYAQTVMSEFPPQLP